MKKSQNEWASRYCSLSTCATSSYWMKSALKQPISAKAPESAMAAALSRKIVLGLMPESPKKRA